MALQQKTGVRDRSIQSFRDKKGHADM